VIRSDVRRDSKKLLRELLDDPDREHKRAERERVRAESEVAARTFFSSLEKMGVFADDFDHLLRRYGPFGKEIVDFLLESVRTTKQPQVRDMIVRMLYATRVPYDGRPLAKAFDEIDNESFKWSIGNTIACSHPEGIQDWILKTLLNRDHGNARQMLCIAAARMHVPDVSRVLMQVFDDMPAYASKGLRLCGGQPEADFMKQRLATETNWTEWQYKTVETSIRWIERKLNRRAKKRNTRRSEN